MKISHSRKSSRATTALETFFYLDPPCYGFKVYRHNFEAADFEKLVEVLGGIKGKLILSLNDHKEVRRVFRAFKQRAVKLKYSSMNGQAAVRATTRQELLISNY